MVELKRASCLLCINNCAIVAHIDDGVVVRVTGDRDDPLYEGYTCVKGRALPQFLRHPGRLLHPLKRAGDGFVRISSEHALDDIATQLRTIIDRHGPRSVALYTGTQLLAGTGVVPFGNLLMDGIGSPMRFTPNTIDKPGKDIAGALLGKWMAPAIGFDDPDVLLLVGINPLLTYTGFPHGNPARWLSRRLAAGAGLVVIDPRRTDLARRATIHLQPKPGMDAALLAAMLRVILDEGLSDAEFVGDNVDGVEALRRALAPFPVAEVAHRADVPVDDLVAAARLWATRGRGYAFAGTGPNMSGPGPLIAYLLLSLQTLCGYWMRAGERVRNPGTIVPERVAKAQAAPPRAAVGLGTTMRVRGLTESAAGLPTAALVDEILTPGVGRVRALICVGGNPAVAFPDQVKTVAALRSLELFVQIDPWMSETAKLATHVLPPKLCLEIPNTNWMQDNSSANTGYGMGEPYARYSPPAVDPPGGSDLMEEWQILFGLAHRLGVDLTLKTGTRHVSGANGTSIDLGSVDELTSDGVLDLLSTGSRIPIEEVRNEVGGRLYVDHDVRVAAKDEGWTGRLDVANADMLADLAVVADGLLPTPTPLNDDDHLPFRLLCRRVAHVYNSSFNDEVTNRGRGYNPAFMHPADLDALGLHEEQAVEIRNGVGVIPGIVHADDTLRRGVISMSFGFGGLPATDADFRRRGASTSRLVRDDVNFDRYTGQPRMSNIPVEVVPMAAP